MWPQVVFLVLFFAGFDGIMVMLKPWMVDMGYNMREIGLYNVVRQAYDIDDAAKEMLKAEFPGEITDASFNSLFTYNRYINSDRGLVHGVSASVSVRPVSGLALTAN